jgi:PKD repeat protein
LATITVLKHPSVLPIANFKSNVTEVNAPLSVQFTDLSKDATGWKWDFGDGATSIEQNPLHTYTEAGKCRIRC